MDQRYTRRACCFVPDAERATANAAAAESIDPLGGLATFSAALSDDGGQTITHWGANVRCDPPTYHQYVELIANTPGGELIDGSDTTFAEACTQLGLVVADLDPPSAERRPR